MDGFTFQLCASKEDLQLSLDLRVEVFVDEQGFTLEEEFDEKDPESDHILLFPSDAKPIGTIRYYPRLGKLGRLAVKKSARGTGSGRLLVLELLQHIKANRGKAGEYSKLHSLQEVLVVANSQAYAEGFYAKLGFVREGEMFLEDGADHVRMTRLITLDALQ